MDEEHQKNPVEAHCEGVEEVQHPHHPSTEHVKAPHLPIPPVMETPQEKHRDGTLPNLKR